MMGVPLSFKNCLGRSPPKRTPLPPPTSIATFIRLRFSVADARHHVSCLHFAERPARALTVAAVFSLVVNLAEDHFARRRLQDARNSDVRVLANQTPRVIDDDHCAVI